MTDRGQLLITIVRAVQADPPARDAILDARCGGDETLRREVEAILDTGDEPTGGDTVEPFAAMDGEPRAHPARIGRYDVVGLLGRGGMGIVYRATQDHPAREVALKVLAGVSSPQTLRRFEYEAEVLGRLRHPGIARIYDAGTVELHGDVVPFFAMELIEGRALTTWADDHDLGLRARLELMTRVADAVHHAHQQGVIHRDLKPANILVDADGAPRVLDFGVARTTDADARTTTARTVHGQIVGTIPYMSPEQVTGRADEIDIRCDVYALGVITYELLSGRLPHDVRDLPLPEAARMIRDDDPPSLGTLDRGLRGDVSTIISHALEKERAHRYQSALEFGTELRRLLNDEPIAARPHTTFYQLRKFARRNKGLVTGIVISTLALVAGVIGTTIGMLQARAERIAAVHEADMANRLANELETLLASVDPYNAQGREVTVREAVDDLAQRIETLFPDDPLVEAGLRRTIARIYRNLGRRDDALAQIDSAIALFEASPGASDEDRLGARIDRALVRHDLGFTAQVIDELTALVPDVRDALGPEHRETLRATNNIAWALHTTSRSAEAEPYFRELVAVQERVSGPDDFMAIKANVNLASTLIDLERLDEARPYLDAALERSGRALGENHPDTIYALSIESWWHQVAGDTAEALVALDEVLRRANLVIGPDHKHTHFWLARRIELLIDMERIDDARPAAERLLQARERALGSEHPETFDSAVTLARVYRHLAMLDEAIELARSTRSLCIRALGENDARTLDATRTLVGSLVDAGRYEEAEPLGIDALTLHGERFGHDDRRTGFMREIVVDLYRRWGRPERAAAIGGE